MALKVMVLAILIILIVTFVGLQIYDAHLYIENRKIDDEIEEIRKALFDPEDDVEN